MFHCTKFKSYNTWYLDSIDNFEKRVLKFGVCPVCSKLVVELIEVRKTDNETFCDRATGERLKKIVDRERLRLQFQARDSYIKKTLYGWRYGLNLQDKKGNLKQYAVDFYGTKNLINI